MGGEGMIIKAAILSNFFYVFLNTI
jgi:hypothetical protein